MSTPRTDAVKAYIILLMSDGTLKGSNSPAALATKAIAAFSVDVLSATRDLTAQAIGSLDVGALVNQGLAALMNRFSK